VRVVIQADGRVGRTRVLSASAEPFGEACVELLEASQWEAARNAEDEPVEATIHFTCRFQPPE
jgi:hypothetical protein